MKTLLDTSIHKYIQITKHEPPTKYMAVKTNCFYTDITT